mmetsp:Transcript_36279/g.47656  ORF Transcript_36279/g.47656 Transcript_36279/m.47656 type:complete len:91 (-) Transcript_36279:137-409(-)
MVYRRQINAIMGDEASRYHFFDRKHHMSKRGGNSMQFTQKSLYLIFVFVFFDVSIITKEMVREPGLIIVERYKPILVLSRVVLVFTSPKS